MKGSSWTRKASQIGATTFILIATPFLVIILFTLIAASRVNEELSFLWENIEPVVNLLTLLGYMVSLLLYVWRSYANDESTSQLLGGQNEIIKVIEELRREVVGDRKPEPRNVVVDLRNRGYPRTSNHLQAAIDNIEAKRPWECIARLRLAVEVTYLQALPKLGFHASEVPHFGTMRKAEATLAKRGDLTPTFIEESNAFRMLSNRAVHIAEEADVDTARILMDVATVLIEELVGAVEKHAARAGNTPSP